MSKYFKPAEFRRCTPACEESDMDPQFLELLDQFREFVGIPLVLTCAYRSRAYDIAKKRSGNSAHTRGKAVDILCQSNATRFRIVYAALHFGFRRIGIGKNFVHLDKDASLPQCVIWTYYE